MLNVNCFLYQLILLAWGSIILQKQHHRPTTPLQGTKVVVEAIMGCGEFSSACHLDVLSKARHES